MRSIHNVVALCSRLMWDIFNLSMCLCVGVCVRAFFLSLSLWIFIETLGERWYDEKCAKNSDEGVCMCRRRHMSSSKWKKIRTRLNNIMLTAFRLLSKKAWEFIFMLVCSLVETLLLFEKHLSHLSFVRFVWLGDEALRKYLLFPLYRSCLFPY